MNRALKFRAWHQNLVRPGSNEHLIYSEKEKSLEKFFSQLYNCAGYWHNHIMQYTGLKDKNGKEIYEGDRITNELVSGVVIFDAGTFCIKVEKLTNKSAGYDIGGSPCLCDFANNKIIGNIYENPELIKPTKKPSHKNVKATI
jgi:uncharacterized phage protein (TIGR01671 family)